MSDDPPPAPSLQRVLSDTARALLMSLELPDAPPATGSQATALAAAAAAEDIPPPISLRRQLTATSGSVFDSYVARNPAGPVGGHESAASVLRRAATAASEGRISGPAKREVQRILLEVGTAAASAHLDALLTPAAAAVRPKKKKDGYAAMMAGVMAPTQTDADKKRLQDEKLRAALGGGHFSKLDKI
jgi:hypothetical protein